MIEIKLSGITRLDNARYAAGGGADYLGFVQDSDNPRYIRPASIREITDWVHGLVSVGQFTNVDADTINETADKAGFEMIQLDGHESPELIDALSLPVIKTIPVRHDASFEQFIALFERYEKADYIRLDTSGTVFWGKDDGPSLNWRLLRELAQERPIFIAGDIDADNLEQTVTAIQPYGIDISTSLESAPGVMDFERLEQFLDAVQDLRS